MENETSNVSTGSSSVAKSNSHKEDEKRWEGCGRCPRQKHGSGGAIPLQGLLSDAQPRESRHTHTQYVEPAKQWTVHLLDSYQPFLFATFLTKTLQLFPSKSPFSCTVSLPTLIFTALFSVPTFRFAQIVQRNALYLCNTHSKIGGIRRHHLYFSMLFKCLFIFLGFPLLSSAER